MKHTLFKLHMLGKLRLRNCLDMLIKGVGIDYEGGLGKL